MEEYTRWGTTCINAKRLGARHWITHGGPRAQLALYVSILQAQHFYARAHIHYVISSTCAVHHCVIHAHLCHSRGYGWLFSCKSKEWLLYSVTVRHGAEPAATFCLVLYRVKTKHFVCSQAWALAHMCRCSCRLISARQKCSAFAYKQSLPNMHYIIPNFCSRHSCIICSSVLRSWLWDL